MPKTPTVYLSPPMFQLETRQFSMAARRQFEYSDLVNHQLEKIGESGVLDQLLKRYLETLSSTKEYICSRLEVKKS